MPSGIYERKPFTKEHIKNAVEGRKGYKHSEETIRKIREGNKGKIISKKTKIKQSEAHKGKKCYNYGKLGENSSAFKGGKKAFLERQKKNLKYRLNNRMSGLILHSLKRGIKNGRTWGILVGYTVEQLKKRLEFTMPEDYNWEDFLKGGLHIDHIIPVKTFYFEKPEDLQFKQCWALSNLRLLPAKENHKKSAKIIKAFQMCFKI